MPASLPVHAIFDVLAWLAAASTLWLARRSWFAEDVASLPTRRLGYIAAVLFGAGAGAWIFGTINVRISEIGEFGRSIEGALAGAIIAVEIYKKLTGIKTKTGAIYALPMAIGIAIGRIGCQLSGLEDLTYGIPTASNWGWDYGDGIKRHPVALYESFSMGMFGLIFGYSMIFRWDWLKTNGFYIAVGFYGVGRFFIEMFKPYRAIIGNLTLFQCLSIGLVAYAIWMLGTRQWLRPQTALQQ